MRTRVLLAVVLSVALASSAGAQDWRAERPYRGLFGGGVTDAEQLLRASATLGAGWDDNLVADAVGRNLPSSDISRGFRGGLGTGSASLAYSLNNPAHGVGASDATTARYYPSFESRLIRRDYANVGAAAALGAGFSVQAAASYQPYSLRSMIPGLTELQLGDPAIADEDFPASPEHFFGYSAGLDYSRRLSSRTTFTALYGYAGRDQVTGVGRFDRHTAGGSINRTFTRDLSLQLGYRYMQASRGAGSDAYVNHLIDAGINYSRSLSFSRRTTLSFSTGTSASRSARNEALRYHAIGSARLNHEIGRTWNAAVSYTRGLQFVETWPEPVFSDAATAGLTGFINRRTQVQLVARGIHGRGRLESAGGRGLESYGATAGLTVAVTRHINTGVSYTHYSHHMGSALSLPPGFVSDFERRSIRAFVSLWAPLFQSSRRP
jgi:hypothetical protein